MKSTRLSSIAPTMALAVLAGSAASADVSLTPIALSSDAAPGLPGVTFARLAQPRINADGVLAFWARLEGQGVTDINDGSIWTDRSGALALAYREDGPAPVGGDIRWGAFPFPAFNGEGDLSFTAALFDPLNPKAETNLGIFAEAGDGPLAVAREGSIAPGLPNDGKFDGLPVAPFRDEGSVTFNGSKGKGAWHWTGTDPAPVVVSGDPAPVVGPPWQFSFIDNPADSGAGVLAFRASLIDPAKPKEPVPSMWSASGGQLSFIAWADPAKQGRYFTDFSIAPVVSSSGDVKFWVSLAGDGVDASNDTAILAGGVDEVVSEGNVAPGGGYFGQLPREFAGNPAGAIVFTAPLIGPNIDTTNNSGVYHRTADGTLSLVAREGAQAPGMPDGAEFSVLGRPAINDGGMVAFTAQLRGNAEQGHNFAIFVADGDQVQPVVRTGDVVDVGGGDMRTVREIMFTSGDAGMGYTQFSPDGTLVLHLTFTDKTQGLFAADLAGGCYADLDGSGTLDLFDFLAFVNLFNAGDAKADCDGNGGHDLFDFLCFVNAFNAGC